MKREEKEIRSGLEVSRGRHLTIIMSFTEGKEKKQPFDDDDDDDALECLNKEI